MAFYLKSLEKKFRIDTRTQRVRKSNKAQYKIFCHIIKCAKSCRDLQGDQLYMAVCFWFLVKRDLTSVH